MRRLVSVAVAASSLALAAAPAHADKLFVHAPKQLQVGQDWTLRVTGHVDKAARLYAYYGHRACASEQADEAGRVKHPLFGGVQVGAGTFERKRHGVHSGSEGTHHVCAYLSSGRRASKAIDVVEPPPKGPLRIAVSSDDDGGGWSVKVEADGIEPDTIDAENGVASKTYAGVEYPSTVKLTVSPPADRGFGSWGATPECGRYGPDATCSFVARVSGGSTLYGAPCCEAQTVAFKASGRARR